MKSIDKWRSVTTYGENEAITVINRYKQKSISLPRFTEDKRLFGMPGLAGTAEQIAKLVPDCKYYIEPFAGTAKVFQMLGISRYRYAILNDRSKFIYNWLKLEFESFAKITNDDFTTCIEFYKDLDDAVLLIDAPWNKSFYEQKYSCFNRESLKEYDKQILYMAGKIKGKFIICSSKNNKRMLNSGYNNKLIEGDYLIFGKKPQTLITTNMEID